MRIVIDKDIPFITGVFEPFAEVSYIKGGEISSGDVKEADAMIIRTRTKCVPALLEGSSIKLIATATIGCDHIDMDYCERKGIKVVNAAGCNSGGVLQYVFTALFAVAYGRSLPLYYGTAPGRKSVIGIIGVGHVGSRVADFAEYLGFKVLRNDPLKEREQTLAFNAGKLKLEDFKTYYSLEYLLANSDIVTIHVPLTSKTRGMVDEGFMSGLKDGAILINTSRGEVVRDDALLAGRKKLSALILDVWNHEPEINRDLLSVTDMATMHIAGYSFEGKVNGTTAAVRQTAEFFGLKDLYSFSIPENADGSQYHKKDYTFCFKGLDIKNIYEILNTIFPVSVINRRLREQPGDFENLRTNYKYRREFYYVD